MKFVLSLKRVSLQAQLISLLIIAIVSAQLIAYVIMLEGHDDKMLNIKTSFYLERFSSTVNLASGLPDNMLTPLLETLSVGRTRYWVTDQPWLKDNIPLDQAHTQKLASLLEMPEKHVKIYIGDPLDEWGCETVYKKIHDSQKEHFKLMSHPCFSEMLISVSLDNIGWLNSSANVHKDIFQLSLRHALSVALTLILTLLVSALTLRHLTKPLKALSQAADDYGRGKEFSVVKETGTSDVRQTVRAFNAMQERVRRFVSDRTRLLAAISHDLRTPITSMRLRVELLAENEDKDKLLASLDEMEVITNASLDLVRESIANEPTSDVDINALLSSISEDYADTGMDVRFEEAGRCIYPCRLQALKRALRNIIENAVKYGQCALISIKRDDKYLKIIIEDKGPGIPETMHEQIFEPFVRLESSRNSDTGGIGLGLAIARSIIRNHGGDITLDNTDNGFSCTISLPL